MSLKLKDVFVAIAAIEFDSLVQFYSNLLSQQPNYYLANIYAEFNGSGLKIGIFNPQKNNISEFSQSAGSGISLCFEVANLEEAIAHLTEMGYPPPGKIIIASHGREIYGYDPAGNRLIFHQSHEVNTIF